MFRKLKKQKKDSNQLLPVYFSFKKRLLGMLNLRDEIDLDEAVKFLLISKNDVISLLNIFMEDGLIEGRFEDNKFIIESEMDMVLENLDTLFDKWESSSSKLKKL